MTTTNKWKKKLLWRINILNLLKQGNKKCKGLSNAVIFVQYPFISCPNVIAKRILRRLHRQDNKFVFIIHDIESIRHDCNVETDKELLSYADVAVVHTPQMGNAYQKLTGNKATVSLEYFDYLSSLKIAPQKSLRNVRLVFAGNLTKAPFIGELPRLPLSDDFQINLYGKESPLVHESKYVHYKGKFSAEEFGDIEGNWGLVWDGDSVSTCSGELGEYLRLNAPFKFSLYLAANRPVVVWRQSAMAQYVEQQHLGICVSSLSDIAKTIANLPDDELEEIRENVAIVSEEVKKGQKLKNASLKAIDILRK